MNDKIYKREEISQERIFGCLNRWYTKWKKDDWGDKGKLFKSAYEDLVTRALSGDMQVTMYKKPAKDEGEYRTPELDGLGSLLEKLRVESGNFS